MKNYLSIDQGTTSSRSIIFNSNLEKQIDSQLEYKLDYPDDGWVELHRLDVTLPNHHQDSLICIPTENLFVFLSLS